MGTTAHPHPRLCYARALVPTQPPPFMLSCLRPWLMWWRAECWRGWVEEPAKHQQRTQIGTLVFGWAMNPVRHENVSYMGRIFVSDWGVRRTS